MPILRFLFRKMWNTRWLTLSTFVGLLVAVSFTMSIPMYADGALKRVVAKSLAEKSDGLPSGSILIRYQASGGDKADLDSLADVEQYIKQDIPADIGFPYQAYVASKSIRNSQIKPVDPKKVDPSKRRQMSIQTMSGLAENTEISNGQMYSNKLSNGFIEAVVLEDSLFRNVIRIGDEFIYPVSGGSGVTLKIKVVGSYKPKDDNSPYWYQGFDGIVNSFMISDEVFTDYVLEQKKIALNLANWYYAFDLREIQTNQLASMTKTLKRLDIVLFQKLKNTKLDISFLPMLGEFKKQSLQLQSLLFTLAIPMIAMVLYYIAMNARQSLERQRNDIAVLRSRGGSTGQIIWIYLLENLFLGGLAILIGPFVGWFMAKSIGSSSGFLTFVDRQSIPVGISAETILYGIIAVLIAIIASLIPAIVFARSSIVGVKQQLARADKRPLWQKWYLDVVLLGLSGYGWYLFNERQFISLQTGTDQMQVQPILFFVPALSIFALGLFFLRIFPWLLRLFNYLGQTFLAVPVYLTLTQLSRSAKAYYPLMLLLILTLGLGVYNSSAARTIDLNSTERTLYKYGTDVVLQTIWEGFSNTLPTPQPSGGGTEPGGGGKPGSTPKPGGGKPPPPAVGLPEQMLYVEPPFEIFSNLPGVQHAARVLLARGDAAASGKSLGKGMVMGIDNTEFGDVAWFREDLFPAHPREYLNLLGYYEQGVLIPSSFAEDNLLKVGDIITIALQQQALEFVIAGVLPYWPSQYPDEVPFFITNLEYIYDQVPIIPYEVWLKMEEGAKTTPIINTLLKKDIELVSVKDVRIDLAIQAKHPSRGGVFGILSLGFLVSVIISLIGYVLYWFFNLSSRIVQFGVLRAMGLSRKQLTGMLLLEQGFTAGLSIVLGIGIGKLVSYLFLPFLQTSENVKQQVPPFRVVFEAKDTYQLYGVVVFMMLTGAVLLFIHIRKLRVHQAVKLGEER